MSDHHELPERQNPAGMARMLNMSRARLYQLMKEGIFPAASRDSEDRPFFTKEQQLQVITAYRTNVGLNGRSIFFRPKASRTSPPSRPKKSNSPSKQDHGDLLTTIRAMGLSHVKKSDLESALAELFPSGALPEEKTVLVRQVFVYLHRQHSGDKQGQ